MRVQLQAINVAQGRRAMSPAEFARELEQQSKGTWVKTPRDGMTIEDMADHLGVDLALYIKYARDFHEFSARGKWNIGTFRNPTNLRFTEGTELPGQPPSGFTGSSRGSILTALRFMEQVSRIVLLLVSLDTHLTTNPIISLPGGADEAPQGQLPDHREEQRVPLLPQDRRRGSL